MATTGHVRNVCNKLLVYRQSSHWLCLRCLSITSSNCQLPQTFVRKNGQLDTRIYKVQFRCMSTPSKKGFFSEIIDNIKSEMNKNKEMKESLKKFKEEADKLEQSDALKRAREKYESIEAETAKGSEVLKDGLNTFKEKLKQTIEEAEKTEYAKKLKETTEELGKTVEKTTENIYRQGESLSQSKIVQSVSQSAKAIKEEIGDATYSRHGTYRAPAVLRKREEKISKEAEELIEPNTETLGVELHKDSKWSQSWQEFKDNNQYVTKLFDLKTKYDESDHILIRATKTFTDKFSEMFGGVFSKTEMSEVLTEIVKMDPAFEKEKFVKECQFDIIPNVLESMVRGDLDVLRDWCHEAAFNVIATPIRQAQAAGYKVTSRILDINNVDVIAGKMMEQGPVLVISFNAQQIMAVRDRMGKLIEGDEDKIMKIFYVWALCRDQSILDPRAAWRIVDLSSSPGEQFL